MVSVNKGKWDKTLNVIEKHEFNKKWIKECYRVLKDDGTIWISGTLHNIYSIGMALEEERFKIIGIDNSREYLDLSVRRYEELKEENL